MDHVVVLATSQVPFSGGFCFQSEPVVAQTEICGGDALFGFQSQVQKVMGLKTHATMPCRSGPIILKVILNLLRLALILDSFPNTGENPPQIRSQAT